MTLYDHLDLAGITLGDLEKLLQRRGWTIKSSDDTSFYIVYQAPEGFPAQGITLVLPRDDDASETPQRILDALQLLAMAEEVAPNQIATEVRAAEIDILRFRVGDHFSREGDLPLTFAAQFVQGLRQLVIYGRMMEENPKIRYQRPSRTGREMADQFQFSQTFSGSFGFTVKAPMQSPTHNGKQFTIGEEQTIPIARRVVERIARGYAFASSSTHEKGAGPLLEGTEHGWNVNMLRAVSQMFPASESGQVELVVSWASRIAPPDDLKVLGPLMLSHESRAYVDYAAEQLSEATQERKAHVEGKVVTVHFDHSDAGLLSLEDYAKVLRQEDPRAPRVSVRYDDPEIGEITVRVPVGFEDLQRVSRALEFGSTAVSVEGMLRRQADYWFLRNPRDFRIFEAV